MTPVKDWPAALRRRWFLTVAAGGGFLLVGLAAFLALQDRVLLVISDLLAICTILQCLSCYRMVRSGSYEVVEGICIALDRPGLGRRRKVRLLLDDGNECAVVLDKQTKLRIGCRYRIFLRRGGSPEPGPEAFSQRLGGDLFLALEDLGTYHMTDEKEETPHV